MNYEQKYHEALERAKKMRDSIIGSHNPESARLHVGHIENIFPELRESEKVRKELVAFFIEVRNREGNEGYWHDLKVADILAYLEKQKGQKPKNILTDDDSLQTAYLKGQTDVLEDPEAYGLQKEQKPAEWSEEDEHRRTDAIYFLESAKRHYADPSEIEKTIDWLKSLRPSWKPSEEQMDALHEANIRACGTSYGLSLSELESELKAL